MNACAPTTPLLVKKGRGVLSEAESAQSMFPPMAAKRRGRAAGLSRMRSRVDGPTTRKPRTWRQLRNSLSFSRTCGGSTNEAADAHALEFESVPAVRANESHRRRTGHTLAKRHERFRDTKGCSGTYLVAWHSDSQFATSPPNRPPESSFTTCISKPPIGSGYISNSTGWSWLSGCV